MKKTLLILGFILFLISPKTAFGRNRQRPLAGVDYRKLRLYHFLKEKDSPLKKHAGDFIQAADDHNIDWRLLPAIAGLESAYGTRLVPDSYNGYGWAGGYYHFESWQDSIFHVSSKLQTKYYQQGLDNPFEIGPVYAPPNPKWGHLIASIMSDI